MTGHKLEGDTLETLGTILEESAGRDAVHFAVEPVIAAHPLRPGDHIGFVEGGAGICDKPVGIVDPFLTKPVLKGQRFWLIVYPRQITSLRHVWTHPGFGEAIPPVADNKKAESEAWLRKFCESSGEAPTYEELIALACGPQYGDSEYGWSHQGEYLLARGHDAHGDIPPELWDHVENVVGKKIPSEKRATHFSCSC